MNIQRNNNYTHLHHLAVLYPPHVLEQASELGLQGAVPDFLKGPGLEVQTAELRSLDTVRCEMWLGHEYLDGYSDPADIDNVLHQGWDTQQSFQRAYNLVKCKNKIQYCCRASLTVITI